MKIVLASVLAVTAACGGEGDPQEPTVPTIVGSWRSHSAAGDFYASFGSENDGHAVTVVPTFEGRIEFDAYWEEREELGGFRIATHCRSSSLAGAPCEDFARHLLDCVPTDSMTLRCELSQPYSDPAAPCSTCPLVTLSRQH